jgi:hypothetical protein
MKKGKSIFQYLFILSLSLLSQNNTFAQVEQYIIRNENLKLQYQYPEEEVIVKKAINALNNSARIEVIGDADKSKVATHILEVEPAMFTSQGFNVTFVDSIATLTVSMSYQTTGTVDMIATGVESGILAGTYRFATSGSAAQDTKFKYYDVGWAKGMKYGEEKVRNALHDRLKSKLWKLGNELEAKSKASMVSSFSGDPAYRMFPFRLKVIEAAEIDDDEAEKVIISGGTNADLFKRQRLSVYTVVEKVNGKKKYEQFQTLGRLKFEKDDAKGGFCDVLKGKKAILEAIKAGKTVYASPFSPYTKSDEAGNIKMAIMVQYPANVSEKAKAAFYRTVRMNVRNRTGLTVLEREKFAKILEEKELAKQDKYVDAAVIEQMKSLGADLILDIRIKSGTDMYNSDVTTYDMNLTDVRTGSVQGSKSGSFYTNYHDPNNPNFAGENNISRLVMNGSVPASAILKENIPPMITVIEITDEGRRESADNVLIMGDMDYALFSRLDVYKRRMIEVDGEMLPRFEKIGVIAQRTLEGDGLVDCKVRTGEKAIYAALKAGELLICSERENFLDKMSNNSFKALDKIYGW